jgi:penicillin-binding protein 1C
VSKLIKRISFAALVLVIFTFIGYWAILALFPFPQEKISQIKYSKIIYDRQGNILRAFTGQDDSWIMPVNLQSINHNFSKATLSIEDKRFFKHSGVDPLAVMRAATSNLKAGKIISGASTISMQVVRLLAPKERTFFNKIIEAVHAFYLERNYSKAEILNLYFDLAPYGGNIYGVKAASLRFFQKLPYDLSLSESALLAGLPQSPSLLRPDRYPARAKKRRKQVLLSMVENEKISKDQFRKLEREPVVAKNNSLGFNAPHFSRFIKNKYPKESYIYTTLDSNIQHFAQTKLKEVVNRLRPYGVSNGAIVVIENRTGKLRAMVGSADFFSTKDSGQINGALSRRCPGSTLKPFSYAISFDKGLYTPAMILADVPIRYSGYKPKDYDKDYRGPVTVREALVDSLNIPAVSVTNRIGFRRLYFLMEKLGITTLDKNPNFYGLSLVLGSAEVRLLELTNAYSALARGGIYKPIQYKKDQAATGEERVISEAAAYLIADILGDQKRLAAIGIYRSKDNSPKVAFKTGTSYNHKDAWTIAYHPEYTIGIWLGNFSGKSSKALVGIEAATPLAVEIFDWLYLSRPAPWYKRPDSVGERLVCALSGEPVGKNCPHAVKALYIKGRSIGKRCTVHKKVFVDQEKVYPVWPKELASWLRENDPSYIEPPDYLSAKGKITKSGNKPKILSPSPGCEYFITSSQASQRKLPLKAQAAYDSKQLFWFIDGKYFNKIEPGEKLFWEMEKGTHKIICSDNYGRSSEVEIRVR